MAQAATNDEFASLMQGLAMCIAKYGEVPQGESDIMKRLEMPMRTLGALDPNGTFKVYLSEDRKTMIMELVKSTKLKQHEQRVARVDEDSVQTIVEGFEDGKA